MIKCNFYKETFCNWKQFILEKKLNALRENIGCTFCGKTLVNEHYLLKPI